MAAYASLVSLMNIIEQILNHPRLSASLYKNQTDSLGEKLDFLLDFVEEYTCHGGMSKEVVENLESQISAAAREAEDVIESHIVNQIFAGSNEKSLGCLFDLQKVILDMGSIKEMVMKFKEENQLPKYSKPAASSPPLTAGKTTMVGFDGYLHQLLDGLTGQASDRQIIPIVGMGGIGKTTLARNVYEDSLIEHHFDVRAWVTISQQYNVKEILLETLSHLTESTSKNDQRTEGELGEQLHKILSSRRYLVILDDIWSFEAWTKIKFFFPENYNRSRIVVTTRQSDLADDFGCPKLALNFLDDDKSWELFCEKAFAQEDCPPELEEIGKKIVKKCKGLPLSIVVIGGFLGNSARTQEYWENVEKDLNLILSSVEDNQCFNILSLSYSYLPACLKPCFLYLGIFPEDLGINVSRLIKLWIAEGFLKSNKGQSLEDVAKGYIKDLIDRNLISVRNFGSKGKFKTCKIHDLLRDLCIKLAEKEEFFCVKREIDAPRDSERRIVIHESFTQYPSQVFYTLGSTSLARSVVGEGQCLFSSKCRLLRVLSRARGDSMETTLQRVNLRFLEYQSSVIDKLPSTISLLWNLQTLIITGRIIKAVAPFAIWEMPQLRHVNCYWVYLPDPPLSGEGGEVVLRNLLALRTALNFKCSEEVCKRMSNIKKLHIVFDVMDECRSMSDYSLYNVGRLNKLESLSLRYSYHYHIDKLPTRNEMQQNLKFPDSLRKLTLGNCNLHWDDLSMIGSLPHLEVLKLSDGIKGSEWSPVEGEFLCLKCLEIWHCSDLIHWNADSSHFPVLEKLALDDMRQLDEIPSDIGEIPTLEDIFVCESSISTIISAIKILEDQESLGNYSLQVRVKFWMDDSRAKLEQVNEQVEELGFTSNNLKLIYGGPQALVPVL